MPPVMSAADSVNAVLDRAVERWPTQSAIVTDAVSVTYEELHDRVQRLAGGLARAGVAPGDRLGACLPNDVDIVVAFYAAARVGAIWFGVNRQLAPPEKARLLEDTRPRMLFAEAATLASLTGHTAELELEQIAVDVGGRWDDLCSATPTAHDPVDPSTPAAIAFTSGTSGFPKGVLHSQRNLVLPGAVLAATRGYDADFRRGDYLALTILNLFVLSTLTAAQVGGASVLREGAEVDPLGSWIRRHRVNVFSAVPTTLHGLVRSTSVEPADLASLRDVYTGGAACPEDVRQRFLERFGRPVYTTYGLTEAPSVVAIDPLDDPSPPGASGRPLPHLDVSFEPTGRDDAGGEIVVGAVPDGPWAGRYQPFLGYWNRPDTPVPVAEGRLHTGDVGRMEDGRLVVVDRLGSVIIRGGANVYPAEVERVLRTLPAVADAVVVGLPDERLGETVHALVELEAAETTTERALVDGCLNQLARYKVPVRILVVDAIDRNALGKPDQRGGASEAGGGLGLRWPTTPPAGSRIGSRSCATRIPTRR